MSFLNNKLILQTDGTEKPKCDPIEPLMGYAMPAFLYPYHPTAYVAIIAGTIMPLAGKNGQQTDNKINRMLLASVREI